MARGGKAATGNAEILFAAAETLRDGSIQFGRYGAIVLVRKAGHQWSPDEWRVLDWQEDWQSKPYAADVLVRHSGSLWRSTEAVTGAMEPGVAEQWAAYASIFAKVNLSQMSREDAVFLQEKWGVVRQVDYADVDASTDTGRVIFSGATVNSLGNGKITPQDLGELTSDWGFLNETVADNEVAYDVNIRDSLKSIGFLRVDINDGSVQTFEELPYSNGDHSFRITFHDEVPTKDVDAFASSVTKTFPYNIKHITTWREPLPGELVVLNDGTKASISLIDADGVDRSDELLKLQLYSGFLVAGSVGKPKKLRQRQNRLEMVFETPVTWPNDSLETVSFYALGTLLAREAMNVNYEQELKRVAYTFRRSHLKTALERTLYMQNESDGVFATWMIPEALMDQVVAGSLGVSDRPYEVTGTYDQLESILVDTRTI